MLVSLHRFNLAFNVYLARVLLVRNSEPVRSSNRSVRGRQYETVTLNLKFGYCSYQRFINQMHDFSHCRSLASSQLRSGWIRFGQFAQIGGEGFDVFGGGIPTGTSSGVIDADVGVEISNRD